MSHFMILCVLTYIFLCNLLYNTTNIKNNWPINKSLSHPYVWKQVGVRWTRVRVYALARPRGMCVQEPTNKFIQKWNTWGNNSQDWIRTRKIFCICVCVCANATIWVFECLQYCWCAADANWRVSLFPISRPGSRAQRTDELDAHFSLSSLSLFVSIPLFLPIPSFSHPWSLKWMPSPCSEALLWHHEYLGTTPCINASSTPGRPYQRPLPKAALWCAQGGRRLRGP